MLNETNVYKVCRTCLSFGEMKPLYDNCSKDVSLAEMLMVCTAVQCWTNDGLPSQICNDCSSEITQLYTFAKKCKKSEQTLRTHLLTTNSKKLNILNIGTINERSISVRNSANNIWELQETQQVTDFHMDLVDNEIKIEIKTEIDQLEADPLEVTNDLMQFDTEVKATKINEEEAKQTNNIESRQRNKIRNDVELSIESSHRYECRICSNIFKNYMLLLNHYRKVKHKGMKEHCVVCQQEFASESMYTHVRFHSESEMTLLLDHRHIKTEKMPDRVYQCDICWIIVDSSSLLEKHLQTHHRQRVTSVEHAPTAPLRFQCALCVCSYSKKSHLSVHMRSHTGERPFTCNICNRSFIQSSHLKVHLRRHTGETPYPCTGCNRSFARADLLAVHLRTHTGEKPYACLLCDRSFSYKSHLTVHMRSHTSDKPYLCSFCGKDFCDSIGRKRHIHTKHAC